MALKYFIVKFFEFLGGRDIAALYCKLFILPSQQLMNSL